MENTALLVIDVQDSFFETPYWQEKYFADFKAATLELIDYCLTQNVPIVKILHQNIKVPESPFHIEHGLIRSMAFLSDCFDVSFTKHVHNAFTDTELHQWLQDRGIERLIISGIRTEQCCETTTRVACDLGYKVDYVMDATLTFDMQDHKGLVVTADEIKDKTRLVLEDRFATITTVKALKNRELKVAND